jgi:hypothetical protein
MSVFMCSFHLRLGEGHSPLAMSGAKVGRIGGVVVCRFREGCAGYAHSLPMMAEGTERDMCRMHTPLHSHDEQRTKCGTEGVKAA